MDLDIKEVLASLIGSSTVFIKGGSISVASGNTTITNGIIYKDGEFFHFIGGTFTNVLPAALKVKFITQTASGYPSPYFGTSQIDIYKENTAIVDTTGTVILSAINTTYNLQSIKQAVDTLPNKADKNGYTDISNSVTPNVGYTAVSKHIREYHDGTIAVSVLLTYDSSQAVTAFSDLLYGLPLAFSEIMFLGRYSPNNIQPSNYKSTPLIVYGDTITNGMTAIPIGQGYILINCLYKKQ
jgi:hypothetical protein